VASTTELMKLFRLIGRGDIPGAERLARDIADKTAERGHRRAAQALRGCLSAERWASPIDGSDSGSHTAGLLLPEPASPGLDCVWLENAARCQLAELVLEYSFAQELLAEGIDRRRTVLFTGPPGCGKTMTARALGRECGMPTFTARLSGVVGAYLGQTGTNLRQLFVWAERHPCVLLLDEIDSLGQSRGRAEDVGELDRIVVSLLQELDHSRPLGLIVAATNRADSLDDALLRRFDLCIEFPIPPKESLRSFALTKSEEYGLVGAEDAIFRIVERESTYAAVDAALKSLRRTITLHRIVRKSKREASSGDAATEELLSE
jgi:SpoVK/Ycf46/Vps4 family AAA+-type ATPase